MINNPLNVDELRATLLRYDNSKSVATEVTAKEIVWLFNLSSRESDDAYNRISKLLEPDERDTIADYPIRFPISDFTDFFPVLFKLVAHPEIANDILSYYLHEQRRNYWSEKEEELKGRDKVRACIMLWEAEVALDNTLWSHLFSAADTDSEEIAGEQDSEDVMENPENPKTNEAVARAIHWYNIIQSIRNGTEYSIGLEHFPNFIVN